MESNCYILVDPEVKSCIIIDSASEKAEREIEYIEKNGLQLAYIFMTHGHADHCWGVNTLKQRYPQAKLVRTEASNLYMQKSIKLFFKMWHEDENYEYMPVAADIEIKGNSSMEWNGHHITYVMTPGHSFGSMCIDVEGCLFTGDTIMPYPPYFNGKGTSKTEWAESVKMICERYSPDTKIYPGHGNVISLGEWEVSEFTKAK